jgi:hypothetical protein
VISSGEIPLIRDKGEVAEGGNMQILHIASADRPVTL